MWACLPSTISAQVPSPNLWHQRACVVFVFFFSRDLGMALADTSVVQVEGLTFRDEHTGLLWTVQSGTPTCLELICYAYMGRVLFPVSPH